MTRCVDTPADLLVLEALEENLFRGQSEDLGLRQLYGGQVLGQALSAATRTLEGRGAHSLHGYFLRPGDAQLPVIYQVDRLRDGGSFSTRRISAIQKGQVIFSAIASFQQLEEGFAHQPAMPEAPPPESLENVETLVRQLGDRLPRRVTEASRAPSGIEIRPVLHGDPLLAQPQPALHQAWMRASTAVSGDQALHRCLLAYASDCMLLPTALLPHAVTMWQPDMQVASLDHALWFHRDVRMDQWLLYSLESPWAGGGRGLAHGRFYNEAGELVASVAQEGLMRRREDWA
ncbi:acyl-CoA thioesterase domain-containing protein [Stutzerimonas tarimensis]|uniref:Acyl-CoA thioesterase domain-containing protein n=1 Tax=Stutzerimonas tarimensis TaxID=1507735 RepID=A0ABV7T8W7_9GAMM